MYIKAGSFESHLQLLRLHSVLCWLYGYTRGDLSDFLLLAITSAMAKQIQSRRKRWTHFAAFTVVYISTTTDITSGHGHAHAMHNNRHAVLWVRLMNNKLFRMSLLLMYILLTWRWEASRKWQCYFPSGIDWLSNCTTFQPKVLFNALWASSCWLTYRPTVGATSYFTYYWLYNNHIQLSTSNFTQAWLCKYP